jgi:hypothetical protein
MKKNLAALAAAIGLVASGFSTAFGGVVITETETMVSGAPNGQAQGPHERTTMIQGNRQKTVMEGGRTIITDLDKGTTLVIDPAKKTYIERPFPPPGMARAAGGPGMHPSEYTKTGKSRTVAGYKCEDYNGAGKFAMGDYTVVSCVSSTAPGAAEFAKFQKAMISKLKDTQLAIPASTPDGIPLVQDTVAKVNIASMPNLPPQALEQLKKQFADRPPIVTKVELTKLETRDIPASEFQVPAGYTKREPTISHPPGMTGGMSAPASGGMSAMPAPPAGGSSSSGGGAPLAVAPPANP